MALNRKRQIDTLKIFNDNVVEIQEDSEYKVEFVAGGKNMAILVSLPPEFPLEKPVLKVAPHIIHPWANEQSEITRAPGLLNFSVVSDLGRVVQAIIREFRQSPPTFVNGTSMGTDSGVHNSATFGLPHFQSMDFQNYALPSGSVSSSRTLFEDLKNLSNADLEKLLTSEDRQCEFLESLPQVKMWNKSLEEAMEETKKLADENLVNEPELEEIKNRIKEKHEIVKNLKATYDTLAEEHEVLAKRYDPENIRESLRIAATQIDSESEDIAEKFLSLDLDVENFLSRYINKRMLFHVRKSKEEKLSNQLKEFHRAGF